MADKFIRLSSGQLAEKEGQVQSSGVLDAGKIPALDAAGKLDISLMPTGIAAEVVVCPAFENLAAGDLINLFSDAGTLKARKADAANAYRADGYVKAVVTAPNNATVYLEGTISGLTGLTKGAMQYLSATAGGTTETPPSTAAYLVQEIGKAISTSEITFEPRAPITLA